MEQLLATYGDQVKRSPHFNVSWFSPASRLELLKAYSTIEILNLKRSAHPISLFSGMTPCAGTVQPSPRFQIFEWAWRIAYGSIKSKELMLCTKGWKIISFSDLICKVQSVLCGGFPGC